MGIIIVEYKHCGLYNTLITFFNENQAIEWFKELDVIDMLSVHTVNEYKDGSLTPMRFGTDTGVVDLYKVYKSYDDYE